MSKLRNEAEENAKFYLKNVAVDKGLYAFYKGYVPTAKVELTEAHGYSALQGNAYTTETTTTPITDKYGNQRYEYESWEDDSGNTYSQRHRLVEEAKLTTTHDFDFYYKLFDDKAQSDECEREEADLDKRLSCADWVRFGRYYKYKHERAEVKAIKRDNDIDYSTVRTPLCGITFSAILAVVPIVVGLVLFAVNIPTLFTDSYIGGLQRALSYTIVAVVLAALTVVASVVYAVSQQSLKKKIANMGKVEALKFFPPYKKLCQYVAPLTSAKLPFVYLYALFQAVVYIVIAIFPYKEVQFAQLFGLLLVLFRLRGLFGQKLCKNHRKFFVANNMDLQYVAKEAIRTEQTEAFKQYYAEYEQFRAMSKCSNDYINDGTDYAILRYNDYISRVAAQRQEENLQKQHTNF